MLRLHSRGAGVRLSLAMGLVKQCCESWAKPLRLLIWMEFVHSLLRV